ncbi:LacI family DNA-binding transcriptional regulator [Nesterenkonia halobia]|uniref:LacI family DNA-binding transcriptional regulator n=1 Tax=Nesterenkonia halobia TaxID=37922 RepID=A0ABP6RG52_9MICC
MTSDASSGRRSTIHEVARAAGVSHQTVSRYLRGLGPFRPQTIEQVEAAIEELNYRPNTIARSMRTRRTGVLSVVLPSPVEQMPTPMLAAAGEVAHREGFLMEIAVVEGSPQERAARARELMDSGRVEGVLSLSGLPGLEESPRTATTAALAVLGQYDDRLRGIGPLADASLVAEIVRRLAAMGHRRFLHVQGPQEWASAAARRQIFEETIAADGLESHGVVGGAWSPETGHSAIMELAEDSGVTAVVAANDYVAFGVMRAAHERGWRIPEDLSVVGWDDLGVSRYAVPALSTVAADRAGQGRFAMERLIALVREQDPPTVMPEMNTLLLRESVGPAPRR